MKKILIVIDMQNGFARYEQTKALARKICDLLDKKIFDVVMCTKFMNADNSIYEKLFGWKRLKTDEDQEINNEILQHVDYVETKYIYNCVSANFIQRMCQLNDGEYPKEVYLVGADTDCCVLTIATALFEHNIRPIVLTNYCDSNGGEESHKAGLKCLERLIGKGQLISGKVESVEDLEQM